VEGLNRCALRTALVLRLTPLRQQRRHESDMVGLMSIAIEK
jgi:hypothetical protein